MAEEQQQNSLPSGGELTLPVEIRYKKYQGQKYYVIIDVIGYLTSSTNPRRYWTDLKRRLANERFTELYAKCVQLKIASSDGKEYATDCANLETILRLCQSIPSDTER